MDSRRRGIWLTVAAIAAFIAVIMIAFVYRIQLPRLMSATEMQANGLYVFKTPRDSGSFRLDAHTGSEFTHRDLEGHWTLIFFGFTHCPDICPTTLQFLADLKDQLNDTEVSDTRVIMVSVDPERDTVEKLANYVPYFNASFIGLTGSVGDIRTFSQQFNAPFRKVLTGDNDEYQVEHSANIALVNPRGHYHGFFRAPFDLAKMKVTYRSARYQWGR